VASTRLVNIRSAPHIRPFWAYNLFKGKVTKEDLAYEEAYSLGGKQKTLIFIFKNVFLSAILKFIAP